MLGSAIEPDLLTFGTKFESELRGDHYFFTDRSERLAHEFFVDEGAVHFSGIEERDTAVDGRPNQRDHLILVLRRTVAKAHSHTAQPDG